MMPLSSGRENLGWKTSHNDIGINAKHRFRTDVVAEFVAGRPFVFLDIAINGVPAGRLVCELYSDVVPRTVDNFRTLITGERGTGRRGKPLHYRGCPFHRIVPNFVVQGGDITDHDGTGGESIYGQTFPDESLALKHTLPGILSMANSGKNTNNSQFFFCTKECPQLDGKHVVFGRVVDGLELLRKMEACGQESGKPHASVVIDDCGEMKGGLSRATATALALEPEDAGGDTGARPRKRRRAADLPEEVHVFQILKKHAASRDPTSKGQPVKCTKGRAKLALANMRKRLTMSAGDGAMQRSFVELAREHSDCESSARKGGDLGKVGIGDLEPTLEEMAFSLAISEVSEPFESPEGAHMMLRVA